MIKKNRVLGKLQVEPNSDNNYRLMKVAKELKIGKTDIIDFLSTKGFHIDNKPDPILTYDMYYTLVNQYSESSIKIKKINIKQDVRNFNIFIVNQNPDSKYDDKEGIAYDFPLSIPNARQIKPGDIFIFNLSKNVARKLKLLDRTITGIAKVGDIKTYYSDGIEKAKASYLWYRKFENSVSPDEIGGDYRNNKNNSINRISEDYKLSVLIELLKIK
jgi:hypothetical protein